MVWAMGAVLVGSPAMVSAGQGPVGVGTEVVKRNVSPEDLEREAEKLFETPKKYGQAVKLFVRAADMRDPGDPVRVSNLVMASRLSFYAGKNTRATQLMQRAADEALAAGDVVRAANAYIDASHLALEDGNVELIPELVKKAQLLTASPLIAATDRKAILARLAV
jgi:hypothetical protein